MALPRENRLPLRFERERLSQEGKTFFSHHLTLIMASSSSSVGVPRFGILLSKKTAKLAVDRNLIKRRTSSLLTDNLSSFPVADYLVIPKRSVLDLPPEVLKQDFSSLLSKIN